MYDCSANDIPEPADQRCRSPDLEINLVSGGLACEAKNHAIVVECK